MNFQRIHGDYVVSLLFSLLKPICFLYMIQLAEQSLTPLVFGVFLFSRRLASSGAAFFQLGVSQTLMRYVALFNNDVENKLAHILYSLLVAIGMGGVFIALLIPFPNVISSFVFPGVVESLGLASWFMFFLFAYILNFIALAILIAERKVFFFNLLQLFSNSGMLIILFQGYYKGLDIVFLIKYQTLFVLASSLLVIVPVVFDLVKKKLAPMRSILACRVEHFSYGMPRGVTSFIDMAMFLIGPWIIRGESVAVGGLILALSIVKLCQSVVMPIGQLTGVLITRANSEDGHSLKQTLVHQLFYIVLLSAMLGASILYCWRFMLIDLWLSGEEIKASVLQHIEILIWGIVPYCFYQAMYGVIDMNYSRPWNLYILVVGVIVQLFFISIAFGSNTFDNVSLAITISFLTMGCMSVAVISDHIKKISRIRCILLLVMFMASHFMGLFFSKFGEPWYLLIHLTFAIVLAFLSIRFRIIDIGALPARL